MIHITDKYIRYIAIIIIITASLSLIIADTENNACNNSYNEPKYGSCNNCSNNTANIDVHSI